MKPFARAGSPCHNTSATLAGARRRALVIRDVAVELFDPHCGVGVAGGAPVAAGGEGAAGADLGAVGDRGALELADLEEAEEEHAQPAFDGREVVLPTALG